jgi:hypothetical protein
MLFHIKITQHKDGIFTTEGGNGLIGFHGTPNPPIPFPYRVNKPDIMIDEKEFSSFVRQESGNGVYNAMYTTHDVFMDKGTISPLTYQFGYLLKITLVGKAEIHEEEVIYNSFNKFSFDYYNINSNKTISHQDMMSIIRETEEKLGSSKIGIVVDYFQRIGTSLQDQLNDILLGMYPREIWRSLDLVSLHKDS